MEMAEYDEDEDFLKVQEQYFDERLDSLGPDLGKFMNHARIPTVKLKIREKAFLKSETKTSVTFKL